MNPTERKAVEKALSLIASKGAEAKPGGTELKLVNSFLVFYVNQKNGKSQSFAYSSEDDLFKKLLPLLK
jgi:hypothetical protein